MTTLLDQAVAKVRELPVEEQNRAAETLLALAELAQRGAVYKLTPEELEAIDEGLAQADRGEFASDEQIAAVWKKFGL